MNYRAFLRQLPSALLSIDPTVPVDHRHHQGKAKQITINMHEPFRSGAWSSQPNVNTGVVQAVPRLSPYTAMAHMRRIMTALKKEGKIPTPRQLHLSQWGYNCAIETPEGQQCGLILVLTMLCQVSKGVPTSTMTSALSTSFRARPDPPHRERDDGAARLHRPRQRDRRGHDQAPGNTGERTHRDAQEPGRPVRTSHRSAAPGRPCPSTFASTRRTRSPSALVCRREPGQGAALIEEYKALRCSTPHARGVHRVHRLGGEGRARTPRRRPGPRPCLWEASTRTSRWTPPRSWG